MTVTIFPGPGPVGWGGSYFISSSLAAVGDEVEATLSSGGNLLCHGRAAFASLPQATVTFGINKAPAVPVLYLFADSLGAALGATVIFTVAIMHGLSTVETLISTGAWTHDPLTFAPNLLTLVGGGGGGGHDAMLDTILAAVRRTYP